MTRAMGDIEAKKDGLRYRGNPNVVISTPEIKQFRMQDEYDFLIMGSDGIFDKLSNEKCCKIVWETFRKAFASRDHPLHLSSANAVEGILKSACHAKTSDNVSAILICFKGLKKRLRFDLANHCRTLGTHYKPEDYNLLEAEKHLIKQLAYEIKDIAHIPYNSEAELRRKNMPVAIRLGLPNCDLVEQDIRDLPVGVSMARIRRLQAE